MPGILGGVFKSGRFAADVAFALHLFERVQLQKVAGYLLEVLGHSEHPAWLRFECTPFAVMPFT